MYTGWAAHARLCSHRHHSTPTTTMNSQTIWSYYSSWKWRTCHEISSISSFKHWYGWRIQWIVCNPRRSKWTTFWLGAPLRWWKRWLDNTISSHWTKNPPLCVFPFRWQRPSVVERQQCSTDMPPVHIRVRWYSLWTPTLLDPKITVPIIRRARAWKCARPARGSRALLHASQPRGRASSIIQIQWSRSSPVMFLWKSLRSRSPVLTLCKNK